MPRARLVTPSPDPVRHFSYCRSPRPQSPKPPQMPGTAGMAPNLRKPPGSSQSLFGRRFTTNACAPYPCRRADHRTLAGNPSAWWPTRPARPAGTSSANGLAGKSRCRPRLYPIFRLSGTSEPAWTAPRRLRVHIAQFARPRSPEAEQAERIEANRRRASGFLCDIGALADGPADLCPLHRPRDASRCCTPSARDTGRTPSTHRTRQTFAA